MPLDQVRPGDVVRVRPGEKVPVDGTVIEGRSAVDESLSDGRADPRGEGSRRQGRRRHASMATGGLLVRAEKVGGDTVLAQIVRLVGEAQRSRAPVERLVNQVSRYFVPAVLLDRGADLHRLVLWGPSRAGARPGERRRRADHRLPLRARAGHADGRHGRHGPRGRERRPDQERRSPGDPLQGGHAGGGQDRHPHRGQAATGDGRAGGGLPARGTCCAWPPAWSAASEHPLAAAIVKGAEERQVRPADVRGFPLRPGQGRRGPGGGHAGRFWGTRPAARGRRDAGRMHLPGERCARKGRR